MWTVQLFKNKVTLDGFADFWREDNIVGVGANAKATNFVFLTEPFAGVKLCKFISIRFKDSTQQLPTDVVLF